MNFELKCPACNNKGDLFIPSPEEGILTCSNTECRVEYFHGEWGETR